ncbi:GGDEF domain-containing protein [Desulfosporosinus hippei]|uniref:Diguanylate cyclase (GGDEF) domain-containing protein n=1 Tax=Desulfosporosinus hippei DSM 8344 TaxID=1121419 RepID=A0A1G7W763_9FIRM|nr:GGDEF domain-containing protein [Desulfosporosinus hippei]SDG67741.1 diguanylate cyclase (GGDEF) domain-containing protein [Desulfosporosinus hippei DSM 8344]
MKSEVDIVVDKRKLSLIRNILLRIFLLSIGIVFIIAIITYLNVYSNETEKKLEQLKTYVFDRVRYDSEIFTLAEDNLKVFENEFLKLYLSDIEVTKDEFWTYYFVDEQGATRMKPEYYEGVYTDDGNYLYGLSSFIGNNQKLDNPDLQRRIVLSNRVLSKLGAAWVNRFANVHVAFPENVLSIYYPEEPWGLNARADLPMNELGVIKAVNKGENPERKSIWSGLYYDETAEKWMITYMDPVDYGERHLITPGHDLYLTDLIEQLLEYNSDGSYSFIIRKDGYLVAHPSDPSDEQKWVGQLSLDKIQIPLVKDAYKLISEEFGENTSQVKVIKTKIHDSYLVVGEIEGPEWLYVRVLPVGTIREAAHGAAKRVLIEGMIVLFAILTIVYYVIKYQAEKPLSQLSYAAEKIGRGEYKEIAEARMNLPIGLQNEIGMLARRFVEMATNIKDSKENLERIVEERTNALEKANADLMEMSLLDGLTSIHNRRSLDRSMARIFMDAEEGLGTFTVMMIDIDFFKNYNDSYGHAEGDRALKDIAKAIKETIREEDRVFRYGGEEFAVIFNHTDANLSKEIGQRILEKIQNLSIIHEKSTYGILTISGGMQEYTKSFLSPDEVIKAADQKLYAAKNKGRNCLVV